METAESLLNLKKPVTLRVFLIINSEYIVPNEHGFVSMPSALKDLEVIEQFIK